MRPIFTSLTPNAQGKDIALNIALLAAPGLWARGREASDFEHAVSAYLKVPYVFAFASGRTGLFSILKANHQLTEGDEVLLQAYTCVAVPDPILWAGLKPVYVDCDKETLNMSASDLEKKITPKSKVLIIQHTFGFPADMEKLLAVAKNHNLFVIEDCAHALGATYKGKLAGTFGDAAFFSFGRDKTISSTFGGIVVTSHKELAVNLGHIERSYPYPSRPWIAQQLLHPILMSIAKSLYRVGLGKPFLYMAKTLGLTSKAVYPEEKIGKRPGFVLKRLANALACAAHRQFDRLELFNTRRRAIAALYDSELSHFTRQKTLEGTEPMFLRYTLRHPKAQEIREAAKKENIYLGDWYTTAIAPVGVDYAAIQYNPSLCPTAEQAARESLNLPTDIHITPQDAKRIINFLNQWVSR